MCGVYRVFKVNEQEIGFGFGNASFVHTRGRSGNFYERRARGTFFFS